MKPSATIRHFRVTAIAAVLAAGMGAAVGVAPPAATQESAGNPVQERMDLMDAIGDDTRQINRLTRDPDRFDPAEVARLADAMSERAARLTDLFPEGSGGEPSAALPSVWERWQDFVATARRLELGARELAEIAQGGDRETTRRSFIEMTGACRDCHEVFRREDD